MERKVLGRGLEALIPTENPSSRERVQMLKTEQVHASRFQPRLNFSQSKIEELAQSIKEKGVIQPVLVRAVENDQYELIAGERRLRAVKHLGIAEIPAIIRRVPDADLLEISIVENIQREELNALDEAKAYRRLAQEFGYTQDHIANRVGKDKTSVSNLLRILNLPEKIQQYLSENLITLGHAKALLSLGDTKSQIVFCESIIKKGLSVRQMEQISSRHSKTHRPRPRVQDADVKNLEEKLQNHLGTKVRIHHGKKRGKVEIDYYSLEDLDRLLKLLGVSS
jgi:ParB family transcriptional regulator, chromosome partitioning protein